MYIVTIFGEKHNKINKNRHKTQERGVVKGFLYIWRNYYIEYAERIFFRIHIVKKVQIVHSMSVIVNKLHMDMDTITRLMNLGIVEEEDDGVVTLSGKYMRYLDDVCYRLINNGYREYMDDPYSFMLDSNAYAITSWVGTIRESELIEMLNVVMSIWGEMLLW